LAAFESNHQPSGKIVVSWEINDRGGVNRANLQSSTLNSSIVENCTLAKIRSWDFPSAPRGETALVTYPFRFEPINENIYKPTN
jgi:outer membrane biosynthesis protein TonB